MMSKEDHINYWLESAESDLDVAEVLFSTGKYTWCLFISHLILEKMLKALYIYKSNEISPPKIHNLLKLAEYCKIELSVIQRTFFDNVNSFHLEGRYPEYKKEFNKIANFEFTVLHFTKIKETYLWLKSLMK